jgi:hypothetical protein
MFIFSFHIKSTALNIRLCHLIDPNRFRLIILEALDFTEMVYNFIYLNFYTESYPACFCLRRNHLLEKLPLLCGLLKLSHLR